MPDQPSMFEQDEVNVVKRANFEAIGNVFVRRLETVFAGVAKTPLASEILRKYASPCSVSRPPTRGVQELP